MGWSRPGKSKSRGSQVGRRSWTPVLRKSGQKGLMFYPWVYFHLLNLHSHGTRNIGVPSSTFQEGPCVLQVRGGGRAILQRQPHIPGDRGLGYPPGSPHTPA